MLKTYITTALRHFKRDKFFTTLNMLGLTIGVTCFILLSLFIKHELSYDQFHKEVDQIYVLAEKARDRNGAINNERHLLGQALKLQELIPDLSEMTHISYSGEGLVTLGDDTFYEEKIHYVDQRFLSSSTSK